MLRIVPCNVALYPRHPSVSAADLLVIYVAVVRSVLEYCCVVWHNALPAHLSSEIERVQMRALRIIYPRSSYQEALQRAKIASSCRFYYF